MSTQRRRTIQTSMPCGTDDCLFSRESHLIVERLGKIERQLAVMNENWIKIERFVNLEAAVKTLEEKINLVRAVVFGFCGLILVAVIGAWIALVLK